MTPLEKLTALGHERANRILADKVMGWRMEHLYWKDSSGKLHGEVGRWSPCTDLNHAKMAVDKLEQSQKDAWYRILCGDSPSDPNWWPSNRANAPADARMAAVLEALDLWTKGESK